MCATPGEWESATSWYGRLHSTSVEKSSTAGKSPNAPRTTRFVAVGTPTEGEPGISQSESRLLVVAAFGRSRSAA